MKKYLGAACLAAFVCMFSSFSSPSPQMPTVPFTAVSSSVNDHLGQKLMSTFVGSIQISVVQGGATAYADVYSDGLGMNTVYVRLIVGTETPCFYDGTIECPGNGTSVSCSGVVIYYPVGNHVDVYDGIYYL